MKHLLLMGLISLFLISPVYAENARAVLWSTVEGAHDKLGVILLEDTGVGLKINAQISNASPGHCSQRRDSRGGSILCDPQPGNRLLVPDS